MFAIGRAHKWSDLIHISATPRIISPLPLFQHQEVGNSCVINERQPILTNDLQMEGSLFPY